MRLAKDKTTLRVNDSLTLGGIPPKVFAYRLGNRSALEWVVDQYQVSEDQRSGVRSDPNRADVPEYIVRLVGQVVRVSLETLRIVGGLPRGLRRGKMTELRRFRFDPENPLRGGDALGQLGALHFRGDLG